ncbi:MAG: hypothetical protein K2M34_03125 [Alphaproteobacteria bacterium]|nr:hypothetical protein [Alphaproteobacteria bacterium]
MKDWLKKHYVGLTAGVIAVVALAASVKSCNGNEAVSARVDGVEATVDTLGMVQHQIIESIENHESRISSNLREINNLKTRMSAAEDSIEAHRADIDSLKLRVDTVEMRTDSLTARVDTIAQRQEKCPCINPKPAKKPAQRPTRPNNVPAPVKPDTVIVVKEVPVVAPAVQNANGCGDDQNANVVINGNNNTVTISNNGNANSADTTKTVTRRVVATAETKLTVNTYVTRQSYCK